MHNPLFVARAVGSLALTLIALSWHTHSHAGDLKLPDPSPATPTAAQLVEQALRSELAGDGDQRAVLLKQALELDPNYAPARWHSGYVKVDGSWLSLDEAAQRAAADPQLAAYRKRRDGLIDTADNQREMARWCNKQHLKDEARIHWAKALEFDPQDAEALAGLNVEFYQGQLLTKSQMIEAKKRAGERIKVIRQWQPKLVKWRKAIESGHAVDRRASLEGLRKFDERDALAAVEAVFAVDEDSEQSRELNKLLIETAGRFPYPEATQILIRRSIAPEAESIRALACDELKKRPIYSYAPQMIGLMPAESSWTAGYAIYLMPGGAVSLQAKWTRNVGQSEFEFSYDMTAMASYRYLRPRFGIDQSFAQPEVALNAFVLPAAHDLGRIAQTTQLEDEKRTALKARAQFALQRVTGYEGASDLESWRGYWTNYSETYAAKSLEIPRREQRHASDTFVRMTVEYNPSCFPAGTPVMTLTGPKQIERVRVGDRVLTQDIATGELTYNPVQATTLRPPASMIRFNLMGRTLRATRGHPFWVAGRGWQMAKAIKVGDRLHGMGGAVVVESIDTESPAEAYNLVVDDNHNYFVGDSLVLAHDNVTPEEFGTSIPGLAVAAQQP